MKITSMKDVITTVKAKGIKKVAVAVAQDSDVLKAVFNAYVEGIALPILVGNEIKIRQIAEELKIDISSFEIINEEIDSKAALIAAELVSTGKADMIMKGLVSTSAFLKAVLDKEKGLRAGKLLSHVTLFETPNYHKVGLLTDAAMNIKPELKDKMVIVENAVSIGHKIGIEKPKVAALCAVEAVNLDMPDTLDAAILSKMAQRGQIKNCLIDGPLAFDNAVSKEAAEHKKIVSDVAGDADILFAQDIEAANVLYKSLVYFTKAKMAAIIVGARAPVVLTSRSDSDETKLNSIAFAALCS